MDVALGNVMIALDQLDSVLRLLRTRMSSGFTQMRYLNIINVLANMALLHMRQSDRAGLRQSLAAIGAELQVPGAFYPDQLCEQAASALTIL